LPLQLPPWLAAQDPGESLTPESGHGWTVHAPTHMRLSITRSAHSPADFVQILGDVDLSNTAELDRAASRLIDANASIIYVDLGGVTFLGSTFVAFLAHVCNSAARPTVVLCRPSRMALRVIRMTGLDQSVSVHEGLPPLWPYYAGDPEPPATTAMAHRE
jgi:anti-anti-sigma factor